MDAKFYIKNLANSSKQNGGEGGQNETDPIKKYLDELAIEPIEEDISFENILTHQYIKILPKDTYTAGMPDVEIPIENKIGNENDYEYVIVKTPEDATSEEDFIKNGKFAFLNEENLSYFLNKFIKRSVKEFIKSYLFYLTNYAINYFPLESELAIDNFKFLLTDINSNNKLVLDDIDAGRYLGMSRFNIKLVFDENETRNIFEKANVIAIDDNNYYVTFNFSYDTRYEIETVTVNGKTYKSLSTTIS